MKFRKVRGKDEWKSNTGVRIVYNIFFRHYQIEKRTMFAFADTLEEAKKIAETDYRFN